MHHAMRDAKHQTHDWSNCHLTTANVNAWKMSAMLPTSGLAPQIGKDLHQRTRQRICVLSNEHQKVPQCDNEKNPWGQKEICRPPTLPSTHWILSQDEPRPQNHTTTMKNHGGRWIFWPQPLHWKHATRKHVKNNDYRVAPVPSPNKILIKNLAVCAIVPCQMKKQTNAQYDCGRFLGAQVAWHPTQHLRANGVGVNWHKLRN